ncbi:MAG: peptidoglycan DD-metalloendopeptidase family protein [Firmicutes bacterium]|nr:peptidoglycan DD-metalloendopeptidase family protein [Bacillota bacterium]
MEIPQKEAIVALGKKKIVSSVLALSLILLLATVVFSYANSFGYALMLDGEEIGFLRKNDQAEITTFIASVTNEAQEIFQMDVALNETLDFLPDRRPRQHQSVNTLKDELRQRLSFSTIGYILTVDGKEAVALHSEGEYEEVVQIMKENYIKGKENTILKDFDIQGTLAFIKRPVPPEEIVPVQEAANILLTGMPQRQTHLVARGDSFWSISQEHNITVAQLEATNPQIKNQFIQPEDELTLMKVEPLVNVIAVEEITIKERIPFTTSYVNDNKMYTSQSKVKTNGKTGEKSVTYQVTIENGVETKRAKVRETVINEPVEKVVIKGTATAPTTGTGRFIWPLASGGTITSPYGPRWGKMHYGVDIAANAGTPIRAADGGVIKTSRYNGSYGNLIIIDHGNGYSTYYAHNSRLEVGVGARVAKGQTVALMGSTGNSTGNHVHFEIRKNGTPLNPLNFF